MRSAAYAYKWFHCMEVAVPESTYGQLLLVLVGP